MRKKPSPLLAIFLIVLVDILGFTLVLPLLPFYAERFGGTPFTYGLLVTSFAFCQLFSGPFLGSLSDQWGRKPLLLVSQVGTLLGFILLANSTALWMVFVARIIDGVTAGNISLAQAYIADVTPPEKRSKSFALIGISFGIGFLVGPAISGYLAQFGFQYPPLAAAALSFLSILGTTFLLPVVEIPKSASGDHTERRKSLIEWKAYSGFFANREMARLLLQFFCFSFAFSMYISGFALFAERRFLYHGNPFGPREVGYVMAYAGLLGIFIQGGLLGRLVKGLGEFRMVGIGFFCMAVGYSAVSAVGSIPLLLFVMLFSSLGTGILRPVLTSLISQRAGPRDQGLILGLNQTLMSIAQIVSPLVSGFLLGGGYLALWAIAAGFMGVLGWVIHRADLSPQKVAEAL